MEKQNNKINKGKGRSYVHVLWNDKIVDLINPIITKTNTQQVMKGKNT